MLLEIKDIRRVLSLVNGEMLVLEGLGLRESNQYEDLADLRAKLVQVLIDRKGDEK
ncbi:MAG: hypothetical protein PUK09_00370 [Bacilli bacterium]|nr:hypothetical protein [Bacilli bacterium]